MNIDLTLNPKLQESMEPAFRNCGNAGIIEWMKRASTLDTKIHVVVADFNPPTTQIICRLESSHLHDGMSQSMIQTTRTIVYTLMIPIVVGWTTMLGVSTH